MIYLSGDEYRGIIDLIERIVDELYYILGGYDSISKDIFLSFKEKFSNVIIDGVSDIDLFCFENINNFVLELRETLNDRFIYLATINSPHIVPLFLNEEFNKELRRVSHQNIKMFQDINQPYEWEIIL